VASVWGSVYTTVSSGWDYVLAAAKFAKSKSI